MIWLPTKSQVDAASRHAISIAGTAIVIFGLQSKGISVEQVTSAIQSLGSVANDLVLFLAAIAPVYAAIKAGHTASPTSQIASVKDIAIGPKSPAAVDAQRALVEATGAIAADKSIPASKQATQTLIAATIALPEVQTIVTDKSTADAAPSESVVAANDMSVVTKTGG